MTPIIGAGMAGLLAGCMIRDHVIYEAQPSLPNNHQAVLRFRSSVVGDTLNIPFKRVQMMKCVHPWRNPVADQLSYSWKANGTARLRSAISADGEVRERYIAPPDLIERMSAMCGRINFGEKPDLEGWPQPVISTIPMPAAMKQLGWPDAPEFPSQKGWVIKHKLSGVDAYCSVYDPDPDSWVTRTSITGNELIVELCREPLESVDGHLSRALEILGLHFSAAYYNGMPEPELKEMPYAKILPIDEDVRKRFIIWASEEHNVYSLGRYATWRPGLLLDDVVNDVRVIQRLINGGSSYHHKLR
jgi:hypothetical protein